MQGLYFLFCSVPECESPQLILLTKPLLLRYLDSVVKKEPQVYQTLLTTESCPDATRYVVHFFLSVIVLHIYRLLNVIVLMIVQCQRRRTTEGKTDPQQKSNRAGKEDGCLPACIWKEALRNHWHQIWECKYMINDDWAAEILVDFAVNLSSFTEKDAHVRITRPGWRVHSQSLGSISGSEWRLLPSAGRCLVIVLVIGLVIGQVIVLNTLSVHRSMETDPASSEASGSLSLSAMTQKTWVQGIPSQKRPSPSPRTGLDSSQSTSCSSTALV